MSQLSKLATPFSDRFIETKPGKFSASYVPHGIVSQFLLGMLMVLSLVASALLLLRLMDELPRFKRLVSVRIQTIGRRMVHG